MTIANSSGLSSEHRTLMSTNSNLIQAMQFFTLDLHCCFSFPVHFITFGSIIPFHWLEILIGGSELKKICDVILVTFFGDVKAITSLK